MSESRITLIASIGLISFALVACLPGEDVSGIPVEPYEGPAWCVVEVETKPTNPKFTTHFTLKSEAEPGEPLVLFTESTLVDEVFLQIPMCEDTNLD